ncbi:MAG: trehalose-6-phosphate synthase [Thermomicrobiales bacterium]
MVPDSETYFKYYNVIANPLLWFLQHYLWDTPRSPDITGDTYDAWRNGYTVVNLLFADEILASLEAFDRPPIIMLGLPSVPDSSDDQSQTTRCHYSAVRAHSLAGA